MEFIEQSGNTRVRAVVVAMLLVVACTPSGSGSDDNKSPVAQIEGPATSWLASEVTLDGSASYDPDNYHPSPPHGIASYTWELVSVPDGSLSILEATTEAMTTILPDRAGDYAASLVVTDEDGGVSAPATFTFAATPQPKSLAIEMSWDIDISDVNVHLINETAGGTWFEAPYDCYFSNMNPDWGPPGSVGDPALDMDDTVGYGPENIVVPEPEPDPVQYKVVVRYMSDSGVGGTNARLRVHDGAEFIFDQTQFLNQTGRTWVVGTVQMPEVVFTPIGTLFDCDFIPNCPEP